MGVFDTLPIDGGEMSAAELATKIGVDEILLGLQIRQLKRYNQV